MNIDLVIMIVYFEWLLEFLDNFDDLKCLYWWVMEELQFLEEDLKCYWQYYLGFKQVGEGKVLELQLQDLWNFFWVWQWQEGYLKCDSVLKFVVGSLVEIGIDYFLDVFGVLNQYFFKGCIFCYFFSVFDDI